jgi:hypothetical protein
MKRLFYPYVAWGARLTLAVGTVFVLIVLFAFLNHDRLIAEYNRFVVEYNDLGFVPELTAIPQR